MDWHDSVLIAAGLIGSGVGLIHGVLMQRLMVKPLGPHLRANPGIGKVAGRLVPPLLHFSTFNWFIGGIALIIAALWLRDEARLAVALLAGSSYLYGAIFNCWGTRGRHPGWMLCALTVGLIILGIG